MARFVRNDRRIYDSSCKYCGSAVCSGQIATCTYCGTPQCHGNGLGNGQCAVCHYGLLPGWSGNTYTPGSCGYKGCMDTVVGRFPHKGACCAKHGNRIMDRQVGGEYLQSVYDSRDWKWTLVE